MARTTIDIDPRILRELKLRQRREGKTLGTVVSELLAGALSRREEAPPSDLEWTTAPMGALVDLEDKEGMRQALDSQRDPSV
jgi:hypothetical protein